MYKNLIIFLAISFLQKGYCQFLVLPPEQPSADYFHTLIPQTQSSSFKFLCLRDYNSLTTSREPHQILTYDFNGLLVDSVNFQKGFVPMSFPVKSGRHYYWSVLYIDTLTSNLDAKEIYVLKLDSNFRCLSKKSITKFINNEFSRPSNVVEINKEFYMAVSNISSPKSTIYKLDTLLNKLDSAVFNSANTIEIQKNFSNQLVIAGYNFPPINQFGVDAQKVIIDTNFTVLNTFILDSLTYVTAGGSPVTGCSSQVGLYSFYSFKVLPVTSDKYFILGKFDVVYNSSCASHLNIVQSVISSNNQIIHTNLISDTTRNVSYIDNINFADFKNNYLYSVGSAGQAYSGGIVQPQNTAILVCKSDTMANLIWAKSFGDDMYYRPVSIINTLDSGLLVSGIRYNSAQTTYTNVGQSFILRLDKNGNQVDVGIKDFTESNFNLFKCYPNPSDKVIYFDVPFQSNYKIEIFNIMGEVVYSNYKYTNLNSIPIENLSSGTYFYRISTNHNHVTGKFIKE